MSSFNTTELYSHTVLYLLTRAPSRTQTTRMDRQWAGEKAASSNGDYEKNPPSEDLVNNYKLMDNALKFNKPCELQSSW